MLDLTQVFAWARMFGGYARSESVMAAARDTFDPARPCELCQAVSRAREAASSQAPAPRTQGAEKMLLILERPSAFLISRPQEAWPVAAHACPVARASDVPVPPPKSIAA